MNMMPFLPKAIGMNADSPVGELLAALDPDDELEYVVCFDEADGRYAARVVDDGLRAELAAAADDTAIGQLIDWDHDRAASIQADLIDGPFTAAEVANEQGRRLLVLLDDRTPTRVYRVETAGAVERPPRPVPPPDAPAASRDHDHAIPDATDTEPADDDIYTWVTDMPDPADAVMMRRRVLMLGERPELRTRLVQGTVEGDVEQLEVAIDEFYGHTMRFVVRGRNLDLVDDDPAATPTDVVASGWLDPLDHGDGFRVRLVPRTAGRATVTIDIEFDDEQLYPAHQVIEFNVFDPGVTPPDPQPADAQPAELRTPAAEVPIEPSVRIERDQRGNFVYRIDGKLTSHEVAASRGELDGREMTDLRAELERLATSYQPDGDTALRTVDAGQRLLEFAQLGQRLHELVYGTRAAADDATKARALDIAQLGRTAGTPRRLVVIDDELGLPWALFYDQRWVDGTEPVTVDDVRIEGFWGYRFAIDHRVARGQRAARRPDEFLLTDDTPTLQPFLNTRITDDATVNDLLTERNRTMLASWQPDRASVAPERDDLAAWIADEPTADIVYIYAHGTGVESKDGKLLRQVNQAAKEQAKLEIRPGVAVSVIDLERAEPPRDDPEIDFRLAGKPLVFINACRTLQGDIAYANPFIALFYNRWWARAIVGGTASLSSQFAVAFADRVLGRFLAGNVQLGSCLHATVRELLDDGNPYGLLYALYGRTELQIRRTS